MASTQTMIATAAALAVGLACWLGLFLFDRRRPLAVPSLMAVALAAGLVCRLAWAFLTPVFYAPDEQAHFNYIKHLAERRALPVLKSKLGDPSNEWEYSQPPLYYAALSPVYAVVEELFHSQRAVVISLRLCSIALWLVNVRLALVLLKRLELKDEFVHSFGVGMICLLPTYTFISSVINNDNLLAAAGTGILCLLAGRNRTPRGSCWLGLLLGVAFLAKQSAVVFIPAIVGLAVFDARRGRIAWLAALQHLAVVLGIAALIYAPWLARNWRLYHILTPEYLTTTRLPWPSLLEGMASAGHNLVKSFWAVSGMTNDVGYPFPLLGFTLMALCVMGQQAGMQSGTRPGVLNLARNGALFAAMLLAVGVNVLLVLRLGYLFGMGQGRHLFPLLVPITLVSAAGLRWLPAPRLPVHVVGFWLTYALGFLVFSLGRFP